MEPFEFDIDTRRKLLVVTKRGYWDKTTFETFATAFRAALRSMRARTGCHYCLVDASAFAVQSREIMDALQILVDSFDPACPRRMAGVTGSHLSKLQASHQGVSDNRKVFCDRAQAEAWLFADEE